MANNKYINEYNKQNYYEVKFRIRKDSNSDVIKKLKNEKSKNGYLLKLVKNDLLKASFNKS